MPNCKYTGNEEISLLLKNMLKKGIKKSKDMIPAVLWLQGRAVEHLLSFN